jgi:hypothetical protein
MQRQHMSALNPLKKKLEITSKYRIMSFNVISRENSDFGFLGCDFV